MQLSVSNYTVLSIKGSFDMLEKTSNITKKKLYDMFLLLAHPFQDENKTTAGGKKSI